MFTITSPTIHSLHRLKPGTQGKIVKINSTGSLRRRILEMGVGPGSSIIINGVAPLGDPIEVTIKGYHLTLRKSEAKTILVEVQ